MSKFRDNKSKFQESKSTFRVIKSNFDLLCRNFEKVSRNFEISINRNKRICGPNALSYTGTKGIGARLYSIIGGNTTFLLEKMFCCTSHHENIPI